MVGPVGDEDRKRTTRWIKIGFVLLVGASAGLITTQGDPSPLVFVAAVCAGLLLGVVLVWYLFPDFQNLSPDDDKRRRFE
ncbi:MAG: hypothetical protein PPP58_11700 [Natronomonas sp.]